MSGGTGPSAVVGTHGERRGRARGQGLKSPTNSPRNLSAFVPNPTHLSEGGSDAGGGLHRRRRRRWWMAAAKLVSSKVGPTFHWASGKREYCRVGVVSGTKGHVMLALADRVAASFRHPFTWALIPLRCMRLVLGYSVAGPLLIPNTPRKCRTLQIQRLHVRRKARVNAWRSRIGGTALLFSASHHGVVNFIATLRQLQLSTNTACWGSMSRRNVVVSPSLLSTCSRSHDVIRSFFC